MIAAKPQRPATGSGYIWPEFQRELVTRQGDKLLSRNRWGAVEQTIVDSEVMPLTVSGPVTDRASWEAIKERLVPDTPGRLPDNWDQIVRKARDSGEPVYSGDLPLGFFGAPRELLGFERVEKLLEKNIIEVAPLAYMRGRTLNDSFIILPFLFIAHATHPIYEI